MTGRRVLILPKWYPWPDRPVHGVFSREQARAAALHNDVRVLAFTPERMPGRTLERHWEDPGEPVPTTRLVYRRPRARPAAMATQLLGMRAVLRDLRRAGWRPDLIHAHVFEAAAVADRLRVMPRVGGGRRSSPPRSSLVGVALLHVTGVDCLTERNGGVQRARCARAQAARSRGDMIGRARSNAW